MYTTIATVVVNDGKRSKHSMEVVEAPNGEISGFKPLWSNDPSCPSFLLLRKPRSDFLNSSIYF